MAPSFEDIVNAQFDNQESAPQDYAVQQQPEQYDNGPSFEDTVNAQFDSQPLQEISDNNYAAPVEQYTAAYTDQTPQSVLDAYAQNNQPFVPTQEYADKWQAQIIADHNGYITDQNYKGALNSVLTNQAYEYLKRANNYADETAWERPNPENDLFTHHLPEIIKTQETKRQAQEAMQEELPTAEKQWEQNVYNRVGENEKAFIDSQNLEKGSWYLMPWWEKAEYLATFGSNASEMEDMPWWTKLVTNFTPSAMQGLAAGELASLVPIPGFNVAVGATVGGLTYLQGVTGIEIPYINDFMQAIDLGEKVEPYWAGLRSAAVNAYENKYGDKSIFDVIKNGEFDAIDLATTTFDILRDPENKYLFEAGKYGYETGAGMMDEILLTIRNAGAAVSDRYFGTNFGQREANQISRNAMGRSGLEEIAPETYGEKALINFYTPLFTQFVEEAKANGLSEKDAVEFAHNNFQQYVLNYTNSTGLLTDFAEQSVVDPANIAPYAQGKVAEVVGKVTGDTALQNAGRAAAGNPLIDILPPGIQQGAEGILSVFNKNPNAPDILKTYGSQGFDAIKSTIREAYRGTYDVDTLSGWQRYVAGIDKDGHIKELMPNQQTGNTVKDWVSNLFKTTNDTKMYDVSMMTADFLGTSLFNSDVPISYIPDLVEQAVGRRPIDADSPLAPFANSAMLKTLQDQFRGVDDFTIQSITNDVMNFRKYNTNRAVVDQVSQQLGMTPTELFDALDNKGLDEKDPRFRNMTDAQKKAMLDSERQDLYKKIRDNNITFTDPETGNVLNPDQVINKISVFKTDTETNSNKNWVGRKQYSDSHLRASIMTQLADMADNYNLIRYNIKPDAWAVRTSNLMKNIQSIALLNFSTSYQVNNFLNNVLTRHVAGVGGFDTNFVNDVNKARGLTFNRVKEDAQGNTTLFGRTSERIGDAKKPNDRLQKVADLYDDISKSAILKGVNNLDIEGAETNAAANIGMNRYWNATWGENIPDIPKSWEALGITKDMKEQVYKIALDSPNVEAFRQTLLGEYVVPKAESTLRQMFTNNFDGDSLKVFQDFFDKKVWIKDKVDGFMQTGDSRLVSKGFDSLMDDLTSDVDFNNAVQYESTYEDLRVRYANEGIGAVATAWDALNDMYSQFWINQTKENGTLFLDRIVGKINPNDFDAEYKTRIDIQTNDYNIVRGYALMNLAAMMDGIGLGSDVGVNLMNNCMQIIDLGEEYIKSENALYQKYAKRESNNYDFAQYRKDKLDMLSKTLDKQTKAYENLNKTLVDYLRKNLTSDWTGQIDNFEQSLNNVLELQKANNKAELKDLRKRIDKNGWAARERESRLQEGPRRQRKQEIHDGYETAARQLKQFEVAMPVDPTPAGPATLEATLKVEMAYDEAKLKAKKAREFLQKYKDGDKAKKVFEPTNYENSKVKTSFVDYGKQVIAERAAQAGIDPVWQAWENTAAFANGDAVTLGTIDATQAMKFFDPNTGTFVTHPALDHFQLLNPNVDPKVTGSKFSMARSEPYLYGGQIVNAGVFQNGKIIAYVTEGMQQSVTVDGKTFPVIGIAPDNPNTYVLYVGDKVRKVTVGKPEGVEYTSYAKQNFHPGQIGSTPTIQPFGQAYLESSAGIRNALRLWKEQALSDLSKSQSNGSFFGKLTDAQRRAVIEWMDGDLRQAYNAQRFMTQRYGETMVDAALLNYNKRYGFDNMLTIASPYQFWMTRSMVNWAKRMVSQPAWYSMYNRIERLIEKNKKDFLPTRLEGLVGILMPNMQEDMGDAWFFDILSTLFPFQQFYNAHEYFMKNLNTVHKNTLTRIDEMYNNNILWNGKPITDEMYEEAMTNGTGELYWDVFRDEQNNDETDTSMTGLMGTFMGPPVWFDMIQKHIRGKDKSISYSPMFRMGNLVKAVGDETPLEELTNFIGGALQLPENGIRRAMGIESNPDGNFADYGIISNIARMATEMKISKPDALNAIAEGPGNPIYDQALFLYRQQQAVRMQGGALATEIGQSLGGNKETSLGQLAGSAVASLFGAKTFSDGERDHREQQQIYYDMISKLDRKSDAYKQFWKDYPDYDLYSFAYEDDPEKRYHKALIKNLQDAYYALPYDQQDMVKRQLPDRFTELFLGKSYDFLDDDEILQWTRAMGGNTPNLDTDTIDRESQQASNMLWYADSTLGKKEKYDKYVERHFPGWKEAQDGYYKLPEEQRSQYLLDNPVLQNKWDYDDRVTRANPDLAVMLNNDKAEKQVYFGTYDNITSAIKGRISDSTRKQLEYYTDDGFALPAWAERNLRTAYASMLPEMGVTVPYEEWLKTIKSEK